MSCVDLCASAFTEIPDKCMCTPLKSIEQHYTKFLQVLKIVLTMIKCSHVIHHVFGGCVVVENNTKHYTFFMAANL